MQKINLLFLYKLGALLTPLAQLEVKASTRVNIWTTSFYVRPYVQSLLNFYSTLFVCRRTGEELINAIVEVEKWISSTSGNEWEKEDYSTNVMFQKVIDMSKEFQTVLSEELQMLEAYHVTQKGIYDTTSLITRAENVLPMPMLNKIEQNMVTEIRESGKCLAFDCATASSFHIMRAIELIMHKYYVYVCKPKTRKKLDNWGAYISALHKLSEGSTVEKAVREDVRKVEVLLQQIKDQDRNLIIHPEVVHTPDEAFTLFEVAQSAIIAMASTLPMPKKK
ncbi:hypothetical protein ACFLTP_04795 [Chloroflexota bacterium]